MNSSAVEPWRRKAASTCCLTSSTVSGAPSTASEPFPVARCRSSTHARMPASAARCARLIPASSSPFFTRRRSSNTPWSAVTWIPASRRRSATASGKPFGTTAASTPKASACVHVELPLNLVDREPTGDQRVVAVFLVRVRLDPAEAGDAIDLQRRHDGSTRSGGLEEQEGSGTPSGTSCRISGVRNVSPTMSREGTTRSYRRAVQALSTVI